MKAAQQMHEHLSREVFPDIAPGSFTHVEGLGWVWTTFNDYQWDLNWANPSVLCEFAEILGFYGLGVYLLGGRARGADP